MVLILFTLREHTLTTPLIITPLMATLVIVLLGWVHLVVILLIALITHVEWSLWMLLHLHVVVVAILELWWCLSIERLLLLLRLRYIAIVTIGTVVVSHHILPIHVVACLLKLLCQHQ